MANNIDPVLYRTPLLEASGRLTREWIRFFSSLATATNTHQTILNTTVEQIQQTSTYDDAPQHDIQAEIVNALLRTGDAPVLPVPDDPLDFSHAPSAPADPLASWSLLSAPPPAPADPLAVLALLGDPSPLGNGASGSFTSADSKTITVINGIITSIL